MVQRSNHSVNGINYSVNIKNVKGNGYYVVNFRNAQGKVVEKSTGMKPNKDTLRQAEKRAKEIVSEYAKQQEEAASDVRSDTLSTKQNAVASARELQAVSSAPAVQPNTMAALSILAEQNNLNLTPAQIKAIAALLAASDKLFKDFAKEWLERKKDKRSNTTHTNYVSMLDKHILPYFGEFKLVDIIPMHLENYINKKKNEVSNNTILKHISLIGTILEDAIRNRLIQSNPVRELEKMHKDPPQTNFYNADELTHLMSISKGTEIEVPIFFAIMFGLRRSEIIGLRWENINFTEKTLSINGSVTRMYEDGKCYDMYAEKTKTKASKATFYFNDSVCEYIKKIYEHNMNLISNVDDYKEFVCVNEIGERLKVDYITHRFSKLLKQNDLKHIRFHDLRHSVLTLLIHNHSIKDVQGFARHANFQTTADIYCHFDETSTLDELNTICSNLNF